MLRVVEFRRIFFNNEDYYVNKNIKCSEKMELLFDCLKKLFLVLHPVYA